MSRAGDHAVVLGASVSGLLAARVLSEFYDRVTVVERDTLPDGVGNRRGVPQGHHAHVLLASGSQVVGELFPGILDELAEDGAIVLSTDQPSNFWQELGGHTIRREEGRFQQTMTMYQSSRPFLEAHVLRRLRALSNVHILDGHDVVRLMADDHRVTGVTVAPHGGGEDTDVTADLVIDSMGRGSRTPAFLEALGYDRPAEAATAVRVAYTSLFLRIPPPAPPAKIFLIGARPDRPTGGALFLCEDERWILTTLGMAGREPPTEWSALLDFCAQWAPDEIMSALRRAEPMGEPSRYRYPTTQRRRYDRVRRAPEGLLVFGDAICSFNPIYGQGMSVAALEAKALRECLGEGTSQLSRRFYAATARPIDTAWQMATGADLSIPEVKGTRTLATRMAGWYTQRLVAACVTDVTVYETFSRVAHLLEPMSTLMTPTTLRRVLLPRRAVQSSSDAPSRSAAAT